MVKITMFKNGKPSISIRAIYSMAMLKNQRVYQYIPLNPIKSHKTTIFLWFSYGFPMAIFGAFLPWATHRRAAHPSRAGGRRSGADDDICHRHAGQQ